MDTKLTIFRVFATATVNQSKISVSRFYKFSVFSVVKKSFLIFSLFHFLTFFAYGEMLAEWTFEDTLCGTLPRGWKVSGYDKPGKYLENCRYVTNVDAAQGERSLCIDFMYLPMNVRAGNYSHGYTNCNLPPTEKGWTTISLAFKMVTGKTAWEIRQPHKNGNGLKIAYWCSLGEGGQFTFADGERGRGRTLAVGPIKYGVWQRAVLCLPAFGNEARCAFARLDTMDAHGKFVSGLWQRYEFKNMVLTGPISHFDFLGYGQAKYFLDSVSYSISPKPPEVSR